MKKKRTEKQLLEKEKFLDLSLTKSMYDYDTDAQAYKSLVEAAGMISDGSHIEDADEKAAYLEGLSDKQLLKVAHRDRIKMFLASDETQDRDGDVIKLDGWDLTEWEANPVLLKQHDRRQVIAKGLKAEVMDFEGKKGLYVVGYFPTKDISPEADQAFKEVESGLLTSTSVGFAYKEYSYFEDEQSAKEAGVQWPYGVLVKSAILRELSVVTIGSNPVATTVKNSPSEESEKTETEKFFEKELVLLKEENKALAARLEALENPQLSDEEKEKQASDAAILDFFKEKAEA